MTNPLSYIPVVNKLFDLIDQRVEDRDQKNELRQAALEVQTAFNTTLLTTTTTPWADAFVKICFALVQLAAPIGSAVMSAVGIYAHFKGIDLGGAVAHGAIDSAFLLWRGARHREKMADRSVPDIIPSTQPRRSGPPR